MPVTTVQKITGAISILMSLMKPSPRGFIMAPEWGLSTPSVTPKTMATMTRKYREWSRLFTRPNSNLFQMRFAAQFGEQIKESPDLPGNSSGTGAR